MVAALANSAAGKTTQTFLTALITNVILLGIQLFVFVFLKNRLSRIYAPRTYLPPPEKRAEPLPSGPWKWVPAIAITPPEDIIRKNGLDAYMFLRFIRLMIIIFGSFTLVTWTILLPVNVVGMKGNEADGLNRLSWTNIPVNESNRYAAHILIVYLLTLWVLYLIRYESIHYTYLRQAYLTSRSHSYLPQARTVLITSIPHQICSEKELRIWSSFIPGGVQNIWVYRDTRELNKAHDKRLKACEKLEAAGSQLLRRAIKEQQKRDRLAQNDPLQNPYAMPNTYAPPVNTPSTETQPSPETPFPQTLTSWDRLVDQATNAVERSAWFLSHSYIPRQRALLYDLVPLNKRPQHRLGFLGLWGRKVDTVEHCKSDISRLNTVIKALRRKTREAEPLGSAFIQCNLQMGAHVLAQCVSYHEPLKMSYKWIHVSPKDVIWENIDDGVYQTRFRYIMSWMASIGVIILGFFPVTFVGLLSNISQLCTEFRWLAWVCQASTPIPGIIQGLFPPLILTVLFTVLPLIFRALAWYENIPLYSHLSISVYKRYYLFLVVHGFLVVTLSSGLTATASGIINSPTRTVSELASHLPDASVFFLTWTVTQGLTGAGSALLQLNTLFVYYMRKWFFGHTPRQAYVVTFMMPVADFGVILPQISLLATIGFTYSVLSPIINGLTTLAFMLFYMAWKFLLNWVFDQPGEQETGGLYFPVAIQNLFVGLYIEQFCLTALFFLKSSGSHTFIAQGIFMIILLLITMGAQIFIRKAFKPLSEYLPMSLATKRMLARVQRQRRRREGAHGRVEEDDIKLFDRDQILSLQKKRISKHAHELAVAQTLSSPLQHGQPEASGSHLVPFSPLVSPRNLQRVTSRESRATNISISPRSHAREPESNVTFASPAPPPRRRGHGRDHGPEESSYQHSSSEEESDFDENGFTHPSTYADQPWIWLPKDELGLSEVLVTDLRAGGVEASDEGAHIDSAGNVEVIRDPPDETWTIASGQHA